MSMLRVEEHDCCKWARKRIKINREVVVKEDKYGPKVDSAVPEDHVHED